jgi:sugar O-acyltransferase (sialic acid O-acetyltransferase NeuD family)
MVIAGAGGHGLEVLEITRQDSQSIYFFDEDLSKSALYGGFSVIQDENKLREILVKDPGFVLGVGNPHSREKLTRVLSLAGGNLASISSPLAKISENRDNQCFDVMDFAFVGPETQIGKGVLINTRAHVHHHCSIGDFTEIGPGAIILGGAILGKKCRIGAGAVVLPGVHLGDEVIVGAGAVVTRNFSSYSKVVGVPAKPLPLKD